MQSVDKNDVDVSKLFNWGKEFVLPLPNGKELKCYIRVIGDEDLNKSRTYALRDSAKLRKRLKDPESSDRQALIPDLGETDKDRYIGILLAVRTPDIARDSRKEMDFPYPKELKSDANIEEMETYQEEVDTWPERFHAELLDIVEKKVEKYRKELEETPMDKIIGEYERLLIDKTCESEMMIKFEEYCTFFSIYKDPDYTERLFESFEQFSNLPRTIKDRFIQFYGSLDIDIEELKK